MENLFVRILAAHFSKQFIRSLYVCALIALIYLIMHDNDYFCLMQCEQ